MGPSLGSYPVASYPPPTILSDMTDPNWAISIDTDASFIVADNVTIQGGTFHGPLMVEGDNVTVTDCIFPA